MIVIKQGGLIPFYHTHFSHFFLCINNPSHFQNVCSSLQLLMIKYSQLALNTITFIKEITNTIHTWTPSTSPIILPPFLNATTYYVINWWFSSKRQKYWKYCLLLLNKKEEKKNRKVRNWSCTRHSWATNKVYCTVWHPVQQTFQTDGTWKHSTWIGVCVIMELKILLAY